MMRILFVVLAWPLIILTIIVSFDWVRNEFFTSVPDKHAAYRIKRPKYYSVGLNALQRFAELPESNQAVVKANLERNLISTEQWLAALQRSQYKVLCLGEDHEEATRQFLAEALFAELTFHVLLLEATSDEVARIVKRVDAGKPYVPLLDANIARVIRAARRKNPGVILEGIEETKRQRKQRKHTDRPGLRDDSIVKNFWDKYRAGERHAILFGALHCTDRPNWLFGRVRTMAPGPVADKMLNIRVVGEHQDGLLEAFVFFLDEIGVARRNFVIADTRSLHPLIFRWFSLLEPQTLGRFHTLVVFRMREERDDT